MIRELFPYVLSATTESILVGQNSVGWNIGSDNGVVIPRNAYDSGINNFWDGNRWCDYRFSGIGYEISGDSFSVDANPSLLLDFSAPTLTVSDVKSIVRGDSDAVLNWTIVDEFPVSYEIYHNEEIIKEGYLTNDFITQPLVTLLYGLHNFTISVGDGVGYIETLQHFVNVNIEESVVVSLIVSVGIIASVIVILPLDYLRRKRKSEKAILREKENSEDSKFDISELLE